MVKELLLALAVLVLALLPGVSGADEIEDINIAIKTRGANWTAARTAVSDLTQHERQSRLCTIGETATATSSTVVRSATAEAAIPSSLDWRNYEGHSYVTRIKDQKSCGACWAFSAVASLESKVLIDTRYPDGDLDLSEQFMISCSGIGCSLGTTIENAAILVRDRGVPPEACYPFTSDDGNCSNACSDWKSRAYSINAYVSVNQSVEDIKNAIATYGVISAAMRVYDDFFNYKSGVYSYVFGNFLGWHGINIVGYNDAGSYFIGKNTWGTGWGENGFFRISYSEVAVNSSFGTSAFAYDKAVIPSITDPIPPLEPTPPSSDGEGSGEAPAATAGRQYTKSNCFIATAVYGSHLAPEVIALEQFRDRYLVKTRVGRKLISFYYRVSPSVADYLEPKPDLRRIARYLLTPVVYGVKYPYIAPGAILLICIAWLVMILHKRRVQKRRVFPDKNQLEGRNKWV